MTESRTHKMIISSDKMNGLGEDERKLVVFNFIHSLARVVGERAVHDAICYYLGLFGYEVFKKISWTQVVRVDCSPVPCFRLWSSSCFFRFGRFSSYFGL